MIQFTPWLFTGWSFCFTRIFPDKPTRHSKTRSTRMPFQPAALGLVAPFSLSLTACWCHSAGQQPRLHGFLSVVSFALIPTKECMSSPFPGWWPVAARSQLVAQFGLGCQDILHYWTNTFIMSWTMGLIAFDSSRSTPLVYTSFWGLCKSWYKFFVDGLVSMKQNDHCYWSRGFVCR